MRNQLLANGFSVEAAEQIVVMFAHQTMMH
jgi:hypothetical protein